MKTPILFTLCIAVIGCSSETKQTPKHKKGNHRKSVEMKKMEEPRPKTDTSVVYWPLDQDTLFIDSLVQINNDQCNLRITKYCLNDTSITWVNEFNPGKVFIEKYHEYEAQIILSHKQERLVNSKFTKALFRDSLTEDFYERAIIHSVDFSSIRSNRIYFSVSLGVPDTDWMAHGEMAIFFKTDKINQIDYWGFKE